MIYNEDSVTDLKAVLAYINEFMTEYGVMDVTVKEGTVRAITTLMREVPHNDGTEAASVFKKMSNFLCYFVGEQPISSVFDDAKLNRYDPNALVGVCFVMDCLVGSSIELTDGTMVRISNKISLSEHSFFDIVDALKGASPQNHFRLISVFLEQLVYKTNPDCQYPDLMEFGTPLEG